QALSGLQGVEVGPGIDEGRRDDEHESRVDDVGDHSATIVDDTVALGDADVAEDLAELDDGIGIIDLEDHRLTGPGHQGPLREVPLAVPEREHPIDQIRLRVRHYGSMQDGSARD